MPEFFSTGAFRATSGWFSEQVDLEASQPLLVLTSTDVGGAKWRFIGSIADVFLQVSTDGGTTYTTVARWNSDTVTRLSGQTQLPDGTAAAPALAFTNDLDTGIILNGPNNLAFISAGARIGQVGDTYWYFAQQLRSEDGTATTPAYSFNLDQDTGIRRGGPDRLDFVTAGASRVAVNPTGILFPVTDALQDFGTASLRWKDLYASNGAIQTSDVNEKTDITPITGSAALDRVIRTAAKAIQFKWVDGGTRTHAGFDAQGVGTEHGEDTAAYIDPSIEANARTNPYAAAEPTAAWYADFVDPDDDEAEQAEQRTEAEAEWVRAREAFDAETQSMLAAPKGLRPAELIPDLYAAIAAQQAQIEALTARVEALEAHHA